MVCTSPGESFEAVSNKGIMSKPLTITLFVALVSTYAFAQSIDSKPKPEGPITTAPARPTGRPAAKLDASPSTAPSVQTAKLWRLLARAQSLRKIAEDTAQAKDAASAESDFQQEYQKLTASCGKDYVLSVDQVSTSPTHQDLICQRTPPQAAQASPPSSTTKKEN